MLLIGATRFTLEGGFLASEVRRETMSQTLLESPLKHSFSE